MEINSIALTALAAYAGSFYVLMESMIKPFIKTFGSRYRAKLFNRWFPLDCLSDEAQAISDTKYEMFLGTVFRVLAVFAGIILVAGGDIGVSFFQVFNTEPNSQVAEIINTVVTGAAIGMGNQGTHFLVDVAEEIFTFLGRKAATV